MQHCSLQHQTLFSPPGTSTTGCCFHFGSASSFFLELFPCFFTVVYWTPTELGSSSFSVVSFSFSYCSRAFQGKNTAVICHSSPVDHVFSGSDQQGHALQLLHEAGCHTQCPGCPTAGPRLVCKPSLTVGCWSKCCLGVEAEAHWSGWEGSLGKIGTDVGGHPGAEGTLASLLPLAALGLIRCLRVEGEHV